MSEQDRSGGKGVKEEEEGDRVSGQSVSVRRAWEGTGRDDSRAAGQPRGLLPAIMQYGPQLMSCVYVRTGTIVGYRRPATYLS